MPNRIVIPFEKLNINTFQFWNDWLLLTSGENEPGKFNPMTVAMGSIGVMWKKPILMVGVRPSRYTYEFMEKYDSFTICKFPAEYKNALTLLGSKSGRDIDKIKESGLTPFASLKVAAPSFAEAELILECKKIYFDDLKSEHSGDLVKEFYKDREYHRLYIGLIVGVYGEHKYILSC